MEKMVLHILWLSKSPVITYKRRRQEKNKKSMNMHVFITAEKINSKKTQWNLKKLKKNWKNSRIQAKNSKGGQPSAAKHYPQNVEKRACTKMYFKMQINCFNWCELNHMLNKLYLETVPLMKAT